MKVTEWLRNKALRFLKIDTLTQNPNNQRFVYIDDDEEIYKSRLMEYKTWYMGQASELLNLYTGQMVFGYYKNPIFNRNDAQSFWGQSVTECNIHRIHTGLGRAIVTTLTNAIGSSCISVGDNKSITKAKAEENEQINKKLKKILDKNDYNIKCNQQQIPFTLVEGTGCWKPIFDKDFADYPIWQYYEAENIKYIDKYGIVIGVIFQDYYKNDKGENFILFETRRVSQGNSIIEYDLFKLRKDNELAHVDLAEIPELASLEPIVINGLNRLLAVPCTYFYDSIYKNKGLSIYNGKIVLFDMLDEIYSQLAQTNRVSTPVEYFSVDVLKHTKDGDPILPNKYNRQFVMKEGIPNGDGLSANKDIETTQPQLNFSQYIEAARACMDMIFTGQISPATLGIDVAKKDNADAQREKEKITLMTRNNIIAAQTKIDKEVAELSLILQEYMDTGVITVTDYDISVKFNEFANPSFETELQSLGSARTQGNMSPEMFINLLYGDKISDEEKQKEIDYIKEHDSQDQFNLGGMMGGLDNGESENGNSEDLPESGQAE